MTERVDIGIACSAHQSPNWWAPIFSNLFREQQRGTWELGQIFAVQSAMPDFNKNNTVGGVLSGTKGRDDKTDVNRNRISGYFLEGGESGAKADWIFWIDDDTVFPDGAISHFLRMDKDFVAGLYFNTNPPYNPIAYKRLDNGGYLHLWDYAPGSVFQVDAVGMGCTLIHRSVYERILAEHEVYLRPNGSMFPIHRSLLYKNDVVEFPEDYPKGYVVGNHLVQEVTKLDPESKQLQLFPFYQMEHGRTEDMHFCELAYSVGVRPWVDTSIVCEHWKHACKTFEDYRKEVVRQEIDSKVEAE